MKLNPRYSPQKGGRLGLSLEEENNVVLVRAVMPESPAERAGVLPGDRILSAGGAPVKVLGDLHQAAMSRKPGVPLVLEVKRAGKRLNLELGR